MTEYPRVVVDLDKIRKNVKVLTKKCRESQIDVVGITKVFSGNIEVAKILVEGGVKYLGDSRVENLKKYESLDVPKVMIRLPMSSQIKEVVKHVDISLNSEISTIALLNEEAGKQYRVHRIILMLELGDLREGILPEDVESYMDQISSMQNIKLEGIGVNLTCYGGIIPSFDNLEQLEKIANLIEKKYDLKLNIISGGNSSSLDLLWKKKMPPKINNLRLGEALIFGRGTAYGKNLEGCFYDSVKLEVEIIELKEKESYPVGEIGLNAFGKKPVFIDRGKRKRAILAIGKQDVDQSNLEAMDEKLIILGASSDHLVLDVTDSKREYKVGDIVEFKLDYGSLLQLTTSPYVKKVFN
ncbi:MULTISPECIES: ornithine racemase Orr [Psychrilyobacter]|uniref:Alanine/ornithine racemase family PLP-dependent enzyme n=1 Tax=Psychrilyobacter piezotolerans TaxID=2293438 RepID=A0ABX9KKU9_9FUSO|nr:MULTISPECIES: ornithine racemase Orr [Psychrilyobacter]MCS5420380.1 ornithine racemase Orr [Psychrilyobacter sp. S5]NDI76384.1 alanine/ornithine racemase family PLP-dependent enzyme [Psychrilyobacter piezotolerans]RDE65980.1 alanine/ornithine racemase family PLP-dependent enzyme [Psychrilyobacter sp. S5]REI43158.1 alanine/ornithine racemase family PLP-dependent enzyme [Psychrilyobacter piezotolerans]